MFFYLFYHVFSLIYFDDRNYSTVTDLVSVVRYLIIPLNPLYFLTFPPSIPFKTLIYPFFLPRPPLLRVQRGIDHYRKTHKTWGRKKTITEEQETNVVQLRKSGLSIRKISSEVGISTGSVSRVLKTG